MLAFLLLLPLACVLGALYWLAAGARGAAPRQRRHDRITLVITGTAMLVAGVLSARHAPEARGAIWAEVHSALWVFFMLLAALATGWWLRPRP